MGNYRNISVNFWTDAKIDDCFTPEDKYFYLYLLTNPHTNICGCYEISNKQMERETGYTEDTVKYLMRRMHVYHGVAEYSEETKEVHIFHWHRYNWSRSEKVYAAIMRVANHIKCDSFKHNVIDIAKQYFKVRDQEEDDSNTDNSNTDNSNTDNSTTEEQISKRSVTDTDTGEYDTDNVSIPYDSGIAPTQEEKPEKPRKHKYGVFRNVLLTLAEYQKLVDAGLEGMIETLSEAKARKGYKYKSDYLAILNWDKRDREGGKTAAVKKENWMDSYGAGES